MQAQQKFDAAETRIFYWTYAVLACVGGFVLAGWGPMWLGSVLVGQPWGQAALIRVFGSIVMAAGCFAAALASVETHQFPQRSLLWFATGNAVVFSMVLIQGKAVWGSGIADWAVLGLQTIMIALYYTWLAAKGGPDGRVLMSLFGRGSYLTANLRSRYEQQIRQAAAQEERNRLARDLHDSIKQQVFVIQTAAATAQTRFESDPNGARQALEQVRGSAREAMTEMEAMLDQLRAEPLENVGLVAALKKHCEALGFRTGASVEFKLGAVPPSKSLAPGAQEALYRVAQEALANIGRHARAAHVTVSLHYVKNRFQLKVQDDGAGFDPNLPANGMGIANMRARAEEFGGELELWSRPGGGTSIQFSLPCTVIEAVDNRRQARNWGATMVILCAVLVWTKNAAVIPWLILSAVSFGRFVTARLRTRKQSEAAR